MSMRETALILLLFWIWHRHHVRNWHIYVCMDFQLLAQNGSFVGKIGKGWCDVDPLTNLFLLLGVVTSVPLLAKIDQEMRLWECGETDRYMHRQRETEFIVWVCPMLYAIAMGQKTTRMINNNLGIRNKWPLQSCIKKVTMKKFQLAINMLYRKNQMCWGANQLSRIHLK